MRELVEMLFKGVKENDLKKVAIALIKGADVNSKDEYGSSPLHYTESVEVAELLISAGADVNAKDKWGRSPLRLAFIRKNVEMQDLLKQHGASL